MTDGRIGTVEILRRYPVKSMRGEDLQRVFVAYTGIMGDRTFAFVNPAKRDNFPWHTVREYPEMLLYTPRYVEELSPDELYPKRESFRIEVETPDQRRFALEDAAFLDELRQKSACSFELRFSEKGMHDSRPISIFGLDTLTALGEETGMPIDHRRFRANFYVRWTERKPFYEDELVGRTIKVGDKLELMIVKKDPRCKIITVDPDTAEITPQVLRNVAKKHAGCAGVYAAILREGVVERDAPIHLV